MVKEEEEKEEAIHRLQAVYLNIGQTDDDDETDALEDTVKLLKKKTGQSGPETLQTLRSELASVEVEIEKWKEDRQEKKEKPKGYDPRMQADLGAGHSVYQAFRKMKARDRAAALRMAETVERASHQKRLENRWFKWHDEQEVTEADYHREETIEGIEDDEEVEEGRGESTFDESAEREIQV